MIFIIALGYAKVNIIILIVKDILKKISIFFEFLIFYGIICTLFKEVKRRLKWEYSKKYLVHIVKKK